MNFPVMIAFVLMLLAPCVVALWGRMSAEPGQESPEQEAAVPLALSDAGLEPLRAGPAAWTPEMTGVLDPSAGAGLNRKAHVRRPRERSAQGSEARGMEEALPEPQLPAEPTLEELLQVAVAEARQARAAAMRADAAASDVAARMAAARVELAVEVSRMARQVSEEATDAAVLAQDAYEVELMREARAEELERRRERPRRAA